MYKGEKIKLFQGVHPTKHPNRQKKQTWSSKRKKPDSSPASENWERNTRDGLSDRSGGTQRRTDPDKRLRDYLSAHLRASEPSGYPGNSEQYLFGIRQNKRRSEHQRNDDKEKCPELRLIHEETFFEPRIIDGIEKITAQILIQRQQRYGLQCLFHGRAFTVRLIKQQEDDSDQPPTLIDFRFELSYITPDKIIKQREALPPICRENVNPALGNDRQGKHRQDQQLLLTAGSNRFCTGYSETVSAGNFSNAHKPKHRLSVIYIQRAK